MQRKQNPLFNIIRNLFLIAALAIATFASSSRAAELNWPPLSNGTKELQKQLWNGDKYVTGEGVVYQGEYIFITNGNGIDAGCYRLSFGNAFGPGYRIPMLSPYGNDSVFYAPNENTGFRLNGGEEAEFYGSFMLNNQRIFVTGKSSPTYLYAIYSWGDGADVANYGTKIDRTQYGIFQTADMTGYAGFVQYSFWMDGTSPVITLDVDMDLTKPFKVWHSNNLRTWTQVSFTEEDIIGSEIEVAGAGFILVEIRPHAPSGSSGRGFFKVTN